MAQTSQNGPTATWLGSTVLFLILTAGLQHSTVRYHGYRRSSWKAIEVRALYGIMMISAMGGIASFAMYVLRRPGWTFGDTACLVDMLCVEAILLILAHRASPRASRRLRNRRSQFFITSTMGRMHAAIVLRSVPRVLYGLSFFTATFVSMSGHTIVSGELIAVLRLTSALQAHYAHPCEAARRLLHTELIGNFGSQTVMALCWVIATQRW